MPIDMQVDSFYENITDDVYWDSMHEQGNFYRTIVATNYDYDTMAFLSREVKNYFYDYEGFNRTPLLRSIMYPDENGNKLKEIVYSYSYETIDTIDRATRKSEIRRNNGMTYYYIHKEYKPIPINRVKLTQEKEYLFNNDVMEKVKNFYYTESSSYLLRSITESSSYGAEIETKYYYSSDNYLSNEPFITNLISDNIIGVPLLTQKFKGSEKLSEEKTIYGKDATTSNLLLPKYIFSKKGNDTSPNILEREISFDLYDSGGKLLQYSPENGIPTSLIWGYNKLETIAVLHNVQYSQIPPLTILDLQTKSNNDNDNCNSSSCKEEILRLALEQLRNSFASGFISTFTYNPIVGKTNVTDYKGYRLFYEYDEYNRVKSVRDKDGNILSENEYHFSTQN